MIHGNERDIEIPGVIDFVERHKPISLLDVGCHASVRYYALELRKLVAFEYDGCDPYFDPNTAEVMDRYFDCSVLDKTLDREDAYDVVTAISTIEHSGISTYVADNYRDERMKVFARMVQLARYSVFVTCPFGSPYELPGQFANVTDHDLSAFEEIITVKARFFYTYDSHNPGTASRFEEIGRAEAAFKSFPDDGFARCFAFLETVVR